MPDDNKRMTFICVPTTFALFIEERARVEGITIGDLLVRIVAEHDQRQRQLADLPDDAHSG